MKRMIHSRGDQLELRGRVDAAGDPFDLTGYSVRSQVRRRSGAFVDELEALIDNPAEGSFQIRRGGDETARWPTGDCLCDVEFLSADGRRTSSPPFVIEVRGDVTRG
jgi:hypothetical protein